MANDDCVEIAGASLQAVQQAVAAIDLPAGTVITYDYEAQDDYPVMVIVWNPNGLEQRQAAARSIFDRLRDTTRWSLQLTSDDAPDVLDSRPLAHSA